MIRRNKSITQENKGYSLSDHNAIMAKILEFYESWKDDQSFKLDTNQSEIMSHSRKNKTEKLAEVLNSKLKT